MYTCIVSVRVFTAFCLSLAKFLMILSSLSFSFNYLPLGFSKLQVSNLQVTRRKLTVTNYKWHQQFSWACKTQIFLWEKIKGVSFCDILSYTLEGKVPRTQRPERKKSLSTIARGRVRKSSKTSGFSNSLGSCNPK